MALAKGLEYKEKLNACDSQRYYQDNIIKALRVQNEQEQAKTALVTGNWELADSLFRASNIESNELLQDNARLKKSKKTWIIGTGIATVAAILIGVLK